jgi:hypothetical protein
MRKMLMGFILVLMTVIAVPSFAQRIDVPGLTDEQILQLKAQAAQVAADNAVGKQVSDVAAKGIEQIITNPEAASTWGTQAANAAKGFAEAIGIAANSVGVSVNEFVKTDAGTLVVIGIGLKLFGPMLTSFAIAFFGFILIFFLTRMMIRLFLGIKSIEKSETKTYLWGLYTKTPERVVYHPLGDTGDGTHLFTFATLLGAFISVIVILSNVL